MAEKQPFWDQIDAILIVNMAHRTDRWEQLEKQLSEIGVADKMVQIEAIDGKTLPGYLEKPWFRSHTPENVSRMKAGSAGCCLSHRKAIQYAKDKGFKRILLMEDDALFNHNLKGKEGTAIGTILEDLNAWDMFYLGFYQKLNKHHVAVDIKSDEGNLQLWRIRGPLMFHATIINASIYGQLLAGLPTEKNIWPWMTYWGSIDSWIQNKFGRNKNVKIWATMPKLVVQVANYSDICGRLLSVEESEGSHRKSTLIPLDEKSFEKTLNLTFGEKCYDVLKRGNRVLRARFFGYKKT
jgi:glycosyl transferase, family 25